MKEKFTKKSITIILFLLTCTTVLSQYKTSYFYDTTATITLENVNKCKFLSFDEKVYEGLKNGVYWIKIQNDQTERIVEVASSRIKKIVGYSNHKKVYNRHYFGMPAYDLKSNQVLYLKMYCEKEANIPLIFYLKENLIKAIQNSYLFYGLYYGFALVIVIINLFYFFNFKEKTFLWYSLFLAGIIAVLFYRDGITDLLFTNTWIINNGESVVHFATFTLGGLFASVYLRHKIHFPQLKYFTFSIVGLAALFFCMHLITRNFIWFVAAELSGSLILTTYWISSIFLFNKNTFYAFFTIAYSLIMVLAIDFFILPLFGLPNFGITTLFLKTASVFEMLILSYAVVYRMRILQKELLQNQTALFEHITKIEKLEVELSKLKLGEKNKITAASLNAREVEMLTMITNGVSTKEMAEKLFVSVNTIKYHIKNLYDKLEISSRKEAKIKASEIEYLN